MIAISTFKTSSTHHDVLCVNYGPIESKIEDKAGCATMACVWVLSQIPAGYRPHLQPVIQMCSLLTAQKQDGDGRNVKLKASDQ